MSVRDSSAGNRALAADPSDEACKHELDLVDSSLKLLVLTRCQELKVSREQREVVQFACGAQRDVKVLPQLDSSGSTAALGNVGGNRECGPSHLANQAIPLRFGKGGRNTVNAHCHSMTLLPDQKFAKILHRLTPFFALFSFTYDLGLITYNSSLGLFQCS